MSDAHACGKPAYREQPSAKGSRAPAGQPSPVAQQASESQRHSARATRARLDAIQGYFNHELRKNMPRPIVVATSTVSSRAVCKASMPSDRHANVVTRHDLPGAAGLTGAELSRLLSQPLPWPHSAATHDQVQD
jgi:hypothetical protein